MTENMEFREIEVGELTPEETTLFKKMKSDENNAQLFLIKSQTFTGLFWKEIRKRHHLNEANYYLIRNNKIYGYDIGKEDMK